MDVKELDPRQDPSGIPDVTNPTDRMENSMLLWDGYLERAKASDERIIAPFRLEGCDGYRVHLSPKKVAREMWDGLFGGSNDQESAEVYGMMLETLRRTGNLLPYQPGQWWVAATWDDARVIFHEPPEQAVYTCRYPGCPQPKGQWQGDGMKSKGLSIHVRTVHGISRAEYDKMAVSGAWPSLKPTGYVATETTEVPLSGGDGWVLAEASGLAAQVQAVVDERDRALDQVRDLQALVRQMAADASLPSADQEALIAEIEELHRQVTELTRANRAYRVLMGEV